MSISRRAFASLALGAWAAPSLIVPAEAAVPLVLENFFLGKTRGEGTFTSDLFGTKRGLTVDTVGTVEGSSLILREYITYDDGARETAIWRFDKTGPATYDGQRTKVTGVVPIRVKDGAVVMSYVAEVAGPSGKPVKARFEDVIRQIDERTAVNTARVSFLGITVGNVEITFRR